MLTVQLQISLDTRTYSIIYVISVLLLVLSFAIFLVIVSMTDSPTSDIIGLEMKFLYFSHTTPYRYTASNLLCD